ncbi:uncharacterized protein LOC125651252 [Ostrea edulis]|uniref:uncharacterized protein LOC125651252 n=1 Tax=Ostrea edulis TaxID=37623 RepID=UPI0024AEEE25|nr:uncharacterized protein LOC125651252 [Ostrea edulis]
MSLIGIRQSSNKPQKRTVAATDVVKDISRLPESSVKCVYCGNTSHILSECKNFIGISLSERYDFLRGNGLCFGCLKKGHVTRKCRSRLSCSVCGRKHPTLLHDEIRIHTTQRTGETVSPVSDQHKISCSTVPLHTDTGTGIEDWDDVSCAMAIIPVRLKGKDSPHSVVTFAFFDSGSSVSFCTKNIMDHLGVSGKQCQLTLNTMGTSYEKTAYALSDLQLCDLSMTQFVNLPRVYTKDKMPVSNDHIPTHEEIQKWHHLSQVKVPKVDAEIGLMIGNNVPDAYTPPEVLTGPSGSPHATRTKLGWIVWNLLRNRETHEVNRVSIESCVDSDQKLEELVKKSMDMDFPERTIDNRRENFVEDKDFLTQMKQSICLQDCHYSVALPFRKTSITMPNNSSQAYQRLKGLKKRLERDKKFKDHYVDFMSKLFEKNYAETVPEDKLDRNDGRVWYIPHHGVYHNKKPEKIRVVFDCSATFMGSCVNKELLKGPDLTNNLLGVLLRFRQKNIAVQGDIEAMFHQVFVPENDRDFLRFLWWEIGNLDSSPKIFRMKVNIFGATSSPSCCNYTLKHLVAENMQKYKPSVVEAIKRSMYVDDCLASLSTEEEAKSFARDISSLYQNGGFHLTKWISNSVSVLESIPEEDRAKNVKEWIIGENCSAESALGVYWFIESDQLGFQISVKEQPATRKGILSIISSLYDLLGFASPFVMSAKILLQTLCRLGIHWDKEISEEHMKCWTKWILQAQQLEALKVERCYKPKNFGRIISCQLHCFSDASDVGMGDVIYLRFVNEQGRIHCAFVIGKSRLAPLKTITIPRKELTAAVIMVKLAMVISENLDFAIDHVFYWTDSMTVLKYIANTRARFHTFIANRLTVIREATKLNQRYYVGSKENPADCASRGIGRIDKFLSHTLWFNGPEFLWRDQHEWSKQDMHDVKE